MKTIESVSEKKGYIELDKTVIGKLLKYGIVDKEEKKFKSDVMHYGYTYVKFTYKGYLLYESEQDFGFGDISQNAITAKNIPIEILKTLVLNAIEAGQKFNKYYLRYIFEVDGRLT